MPKKKSSVYAKPSSPAHPALQTSHKVINHLSSDPDAGVKSVNNRLRRLRLTQKGDGSRPFEAPPSRTIHPDLQTILQTSHSSPPIPRLSLPSHGGSRGLAGPPPPHSWLDRRLTEGSKPENVMKNGQKAPPLPGYDLPEPGTLLDLALKQLAREWYFHYEYDQYYLPTIPVRYKELLLHFIALYNPYVIDRKSLERLFLDETELEAATGAVDLSRLDLSTSLGRSLTLRDLKLFFTPRNKSLLTAAAADTDTVSSNIPESWDLTGLLQPPRFTTLTHLSLSSPSPNISWPHLLNYLLPCLPSQSLTHLSLAFWPFPTLTPNSLTATSLSPAGPIQAGGSNFYSSYDLDWTEPALILRRLARATLGLQWLDLTGNWPWIQALGDHGFDWSGGGLWAGLETLVVGQGRVPDCFAPSDLCSTGNGQKKDPLSGARSHILTNNDQKSSQSHKISTATDTLPLPNLYREQYPFIFIRSSGLDRARAYEHMCSTSDGQNLLKWARNEQASLEFEQTFKSKLREAVSMSPGIEVNEGEEDVWGPPKSWGAGSKPQTTAEHSFVDRRMEGGEEGRQEITSQRRNGIQFERGWTGAWVRKAIEEISEYEAEVLARRR